MEANGTAPGLRLIDVFNRADLNHDGGITRDEAKEFFEEAGIGDGFMGGTKVRILVDAFFENCDNEPNGIIDLAELRQNSSQFLEMSGLGLDIFDAADKKPKDARVDYDELEPELLRRLEESGTSWADAKADAGAKLAVAVAGRGDYVYRDDLVSLLADIAKTWGAFWLKWWS